MCKSTCIVLMSKHIVCRFKNNTRTLQVCLFVCMYEETEYSAFQEIHRDALSTYKIPKLLKVL